MRASRETRDKRPVLPKVERVDLSEKHIPLRVIGIVLCVAVAIGAFAYGIIGLTKTEDGWTTVTVDSSAGITVGSELVFSYELGAGERSAAAELKAVKQLYTDAAVGATHLFDTASEETYGGISRLNAHPGETVTLNETFYRALETLSGDRTLFLGALTGDINALLWAESEAEATEFDPLSNQTEADWCQKVADFAKNPDHMRIELYGDNQAKLVLSDAYMTFAKKYSITDYVDLFYMKNAFAVDYIADALIGAGYTHGALSSLDGYVRRMDGRDYSLSYNLFDYRDGSPVLVGRYDYQSPAAIVCLRSFPINETEKAYAGIMSDGTFRNRYISLQNGGCRYAANTLLVAKEGASCTELLLAYKDSYISDKMVLNDPTDATVIWCDGETVFANREPLPLADVAENYEIAYYKYSE